MINEISWNFPGWPREKRCINCQLCVQSSNQRNQTKPNICKGYLKWKKEIFIYVFPFVSRRFIVIPFKENFAKKFKTKTIDRFQQYFTRHCGASVSSLPNVIEGKTVLEKVIQKGNRMTCDLILLLVMRCIVVI